MNLINTETTALAIDNMAHQAEDAAERFKYIAKQMRDKNDLTYASEAISEATNLMNLFRLDLLVTRPIREFQKGA